MASHARTYLALGDSYTIGEGVPLFESFPYQVVQLLRKSGHNFHAPEIIAKTGWSTDELIQGINSNLLQATYDFVTVLIGVNNQYRGRSIEEYFPQFEQLLIRAIQFCGNHPSHVIVLSIPDWGATPFAADRDQKKITGEINAFNAVNKNITAQYKAHYIDITPGTRVSAKDETMLTADKLHPSGKEYSLWASRVAQIISSL